jgi:hypothetical protein
MMYDFTHKKFVALPLERQHKKCAELVRHLYEGWGTNDTLKPDLELYLTMLNWMQHPPPTPPISHKTLADHYHMHLQKAHQSKKEHHLLPAIRHEDRLEAEETWPIAIYLDEVRSAHNVGSIIRTTEAFALGKLYFSSNTPHATHKQVRDTAMGTEEWVSCTQGTELEMLPLKPLRMQFHCMHLSFPLLSP